MRKVYIEIKNRLIINMNEGTEIGDVISEMDYNFISQTDGANIIDSEIIDYEVTNSK